MSVAVGTRPTFPHFTFTFTFTISPWPLFATSTASYPRPSNMEGIQNVFGGMLIGIVVSCLSAHFSCSHFLFTGANHRPSFHAEHGVS